MKDFLKSRWVLLLVLGVFIVLKIPHLSYPFYWDESWPYAPAIKAMYNHGPSLMPGALDPDLSRGHPLFFHAAAAMWMNIFGTSHTSLHSFALFISLCTLIAIFEIGYRLFNQRVAVIALLLLASQEIFIIQSSFVLLEVCLALFCLLSIYFYSKDKYILTALSVTALFYTKESGLILGAIIGVDASVRLFYKNTDRRAALLRLASIAAPCVLAGVFFLLQKQARGWYIFPYHSQIIEFYWHSFWYKFRMDCVSATFYTNLKYYYYLLLLLIAVVASVKNRNARFIAIFIPIYFIYYFVNDMRAGRILPSVPFFTLFVIGWFYTIYVFANSKVFSSLAQRRFIFLTGCFALFFLCFSAMNFFSYRYILAVMVPMMVVVAALFDVLIANSYKVMYYISLTAFAIISFFAIKDNNNYGDTDFGAFKAMKVGQQVVSYMEEQGYYDRNIGLGSYLQQQQLIEPAAGYLRSDRKFTNVRMDIDGNSEFAIFNNVENDARRDEFKKETSFRLERRFEEGNVWAEVYRRK